MNRHLKILGLILLLAVIAAKPALVWAEEAAAEAGAEGGEGGGEKAPVAESKKNIIEGDPGSPSLKGPYIELKQMNVVAIYRGVPVRHMNYILVLEMPDMEEYRFVLQRIEILRSAMVEELHVIGSSQKGALLKDYDFIKDRLLKVADKTVGQGHVKSVLIKSTAGRNLPEFYTVPKK
ncbi:MAG: hypothetical protein EYC62_07295 [Alphaproteobacteria bacterium]|nr:MAG: hypothetical protein EYC62_07295 [Alphaproteobacteria bacterium]